jgi:hypothetical protein
MRHWLPATFIILGLAIALYAFVKPSTHRSSPEDDEARRIVEVCAGGFTETGKAGLSANLARQLRQLHAASEVSSVQVGAVIAKIRPDEVGREVYKIYVRCLKQQTELSLRARGVRIDAAPDRQEPSEAVSGPVAENSRMDVDPEPPAAQATPGRPIQPPRRSAEAPATYKTEGDCSPLIVGSNVTNINQQCAEPPP